MARKEFTEEDLAILRNNPYVKNVTQCKIRFTVAFKSASSFRVTKAAKDSARGDRMESLLSVREC
jgi:hypothetical protein